MCGIAGILVYQDAPTLQVGETLAVMSERLRVRGPDASGAWRSPSGMLHFAHRRLSIIDLSARSDQPLHSADGRYTIVFNGEIYNYQDLRAQLQQKGCVFTTTGDTEVLLQMYAQYGAAMLDQLRGMYAFAIWDEHEQQLFLARDPLGIKPLYYAQANGCLHFASQAKALLDVPGVDLSPQPAGHVGFFVWGSVPEPWTLYRGIFSCPSGTWILAGTRGIRETRQFASSAEECIRFSPDQIPRTEAECTERLHAALEESVRVHEIADVPVGIFLSAGIDSGMMASLASERSDRLEALTLGFDLLRGTPSDETVLATAVARHYGLPQRLEFIDRSVFHDECDRLLDTMDQPTIDGVNTYFVSRLAKQMGFKVALSGLGGDELFAGYPSFRNIPSTVHALGLFSRVPALGRGWRVLTAPVVSRLTSPKYASLLEYGGTWGGAYLLRRGLFMPWELPQFLDPELVRTGWRDLGSVEQMNTLLRPFREMKNVPQEQSDWLRVSALETSYYMRSQLLRDADWAGMAHSIEIRVPLVDMTLLRQLAPLRASRFAPHKPGVANCLKKPLPQEILSRPKTGFSVPVREWMHGPLTRGLRSWAKYVYSSLYGALPSAAEEVTAAH
jgi:asparagine synthase (glutamine-hydrolysing)